MRDADEERRRQIELDEKLRVSKRERQQWLSENRDAIAAYNKNVDAYGVFSDGLRCF